MHPVSLVFLSHKHMQTTHDVATASSVLAAVQEALALRDAVSNPGKLSAAFTALLLEQT